MKNEENEFLTGKNEILRICERFYTEPYSSAPQDRQPLTKEYQPRHIRDRYHGGRPPSSDDSFDSPTVIPPSALDKPRIMKRYYRR